MMSTLVLEPMTDLERELRAERERLDVFLCVMGTCETKHGRETGEEAEAMAAEARATDPAARATLLRGLDAIRTAWARMTIDDRRGVLVRLAERVEVGRSGVKCRWRSVAALVGGKRPIT